jgi:hypothetical protein
VEDGVAQVEISGVGAGTASIVATDGEGDYGSTVEYAAAAPEVGSSGGVTEGVMSNTSGFTFLVADPSLSAITIHYNTSGSTLPASLMGQLSSGSVTIPATTNPSDPITSVFVPFNVPDDGKIAPTRVAVLNLEVPNVPADQTDHAQMNVYNNDLPGITIDGQQTGANVDVDPESENDPTLLVPVKLTVNHDGDLTSSTFSWDPSQDVIWLTDQIGTVGVNDLASLPGAHWNGTTETYTWDGAPPSQVWDQPIGGSPTVDGTSEELEADVTIPATQVVAAQTATPLNIAEATQAGIWIDVSGSGMIPDTTPGIAGQVMIGAGITVTAVYMGPEDPLLSRIETPDWMIPGATNNPNTATAIAGYDPTILPIFGSDDEQVQVLDSAALDSVSVHFYFLNLPQAETIRTISFNGTVGNFGYHAELQLRVWSPESNAAGSDLEGEPSVLGNRLGPRYTFPANPLAVQFGQTVTSPTLFAAGQWQYTQLLYFHATASSADGSQYAFQKNTSAGFELDNSFAYLGNTYSVDPTESHIFFDAPYIGLASFKIETLTVLAKTYVMYQPNGPDTIWVAIKQRDWGFSESAQYDSQDPISPWTLLSGTGVHLYSWEYGSAEPQWEDIFTNGTAAWTQI